MVDDPPREKAASWTAKRDPAVHGPFALAHDGGERRLRLAFGLHLLLVLVRLLDDGQLGVGVRHGQVGVRRVAGAVEHQRPLLEEALVGGGILLVLRRGEPHLERPLASGVLCPRVGGHEGPLGESVVAVVVVGPRREDHGARAHRRPEEQLDVAASGRVQGDDGLNVLQVVDLGVSARAGGRLQSQEQGFIRWDFPDGLI